MSDQNDNNLDRLLGSGGDDRPKSIEEMLRVDNADKKKEADARKEKEKSTKIKIGTGIAAFALLVGGGLLLNPWTNPFGAEEIIEKKKNTGTLNSNQAEGGSEEWYYSDNKDSVTPVDLEDWALEAAEVEANNIPEEQQEDMAKKVEGTGLKVNTDAMLFSEANGYTSDPTKAQDENGLPLPNYSYWTSELFIRESGVITEKLLNPYYGGWGEYQFSDSMARTDFNERLFEPFVSKKYMKKYFNRKDKSYLPVYADWDSNDYGMGKVLLPHVVDGRWFGEITNAKINFTYKKDILGYVAKARYNVKFTAYTDKKKKVTKNGVLTIDYVPSSNAVGDQTYMRVVIDDAKLVVKN